MKSSVENKKQILILVSRFPYPLDKGDKLRAFHQLKELSKSFDVTLFALSDQEVSAEHKEIVQKYCAHIIVHQQTMIQIAWNTFKSFFNSSPFQVGYFYSTKAHRAVKNLIKDNGYKHIYCQLIRMSEYVKDEHSIPKTIDFQDALSAGIQRRVEKQPFYKKWLFKSEAKRLRAYESKMFDFFENKTIISQQDRLLILHPEASKIRCVPNGIDASFFEKSPIEKTHDFLFIGNMSYPPNIEAVTYIHNNLLPHFPQSKLLISGSSPTSEVLKLSETSDQVDVTGWVDDIRSSYQRGKIFVAPMMLGTGMQNKLLEAMAMGIPCITTNLANAPIRTTHKKEILVANDELEFISSIKQLLNNHELYEKIQQNASAFVRDEYSWEKATSELIELIHNPL